MNATKSFKTKAKNRILGFLHNSFSDYKAARLLFLNGHDVQACFMANTSIEKLLKARLAFDDIEFKKNHDCNKLLTLVEEVSEFIKGKINREFLKALLNIYLGRYLSDQKPGYNYTIVSRKFLAELDYTYDTIAHSLVFPNQNQMNLYSSETNDPLILAHNYLLNGIDKTSFCERLDRVIEYRIMPNYEDLLMDYPTLKSKNDGKFMYESIIMDSTMNAATTTHEPDLTGLSL
ncbi:MAG: HEPN domain-containing protein [Saprospiraceae bacterium]